MMTIKQIMEAQRACFGSGATLSPDARRASLVKLKGGIRKCESEILDALHSDLGKSASEGYMTEVGALYSDIDNALRHLKGWMRPKRVGTPVAIAPARSKIVCCPYGVTLIMAPWNYPFLLTISPLIGALAAGNCAVVKPSELAPATAGVIAGMLSGIFDPGLVAVVNGGAETGKELLEERFDYIFYTGNGTVGRYVMEKAARNLTPVLLELGGKSPVIVTRSADLRVAARRIAFGKWLNLGQTCVAPDYVLVEECVHDAFVQCLKEEIPAMYGERPLDNPAYGKIINRRHYERVSRLIDRDKVVYGGEADAEALRIAPTVMDRVLPQDAVMGEEIFGPVLPVLVVGNLEEAVAFVRKRPHPLALYLFTSDRREERRVMGTLRFGGGCVNDTIVHLVNHRLPFGGIGDSGIGTYQGYHSFLAFSHAKGIVKTPVRVDPKIRYQPYTRLKDWLVRKFM